MFTIAAHEITPAIAALFDPDLPTMPRALNVLEGSTRGQIVADDRAHPTWAAVREASYGTVYLGGQLGDPPLANLIAHFRRLGDVGVSCWPGDPLAAQLPPAPDYDGAAIYFTQRSPQVALQPLIDRLPPGYRLAQRDAALLAQSPDYASTLAAFGTAERIMRLTLGVVVLSEDAVVCEAATGAPTHGRIEVGVTTVEHHRRRGLAASACAALIALCEARGLRTWWDCAKQNTASIQLARRLGYLAGREYRYRWWCK
jgi:RimJ/RimL family protein N-acetyltransferase